jgi:hypothetical protein
LKAVDSLIEDSLMITEGGPTDSESITILFHNHGINMRYLGHVLRRFRKMCEERKVVFKHIEFLLEKEIFVRSMKHVFTNHISNNS